MSAAQRILVVEDEPHVRFVLRTALESSAYVISTAPDGETALLSLRQEPFDLILLDLNMPRMGGMEVLGRLREQGSDIPVIIISAHDSVPNVVQAMKLGAIDFLSKPLTPDTLRREVAQVLSKECGHEQESVAQEPESASPRKSMLASAKRALRHRLFSRAGLLLQEAIKEEPGAAEPRYLLGVLHEVEGKSRAASEAYQDALRVDPEYEPARLHLMKYRDGK